jgi:DNA-binding PadR family transcriptional regulator
VTHTFDIDIAKDYGIESAIIMQNISFWIEKNKANGVHFHDGYYWTYNSIKAFNELFPYMSESTIRRTLKSLEENGIIKTGNYNKVGYDRTMWYAITEKGFCILNKSILSNQQMDLSEMSNGNGQSNKPIPDIKPVIKQDNKQIDNDFNTFYSQYQKKTNKTDAKKTFYKLVKSGITLDYILSKLKIYESQIERDKTEIKYIRNPQRFLNTLEDFEDSKPLPLPDKVPREKKKCPKCGGDIRGSACVLCYTNFDYQGNEI